MSSLVRRVRVEWCLAVPLPIFHTNVSGEMTRTTLDMLSSHKEFARDILAFRIRSSEMGASP